MDDTYSFSGYLGSGGKISGVVLQLVNFALAFFIYLPFLKIWDKQKVAEEKGVKKENGYDRDESFSFDFAWGNARSCSMEAIDCAKRGEFTEAEAKLQEALEELKRRTVYKRTSYRKKLVVKRRK